MTETLDDGDGVGNNTDTDDDGDTLLDTDEVAAGTNPLLADMDDVRGDSLDVFPLDAAETSIRVMASAITPTSMTMATASTTLMPSRLNTDARYRWRRRRQQHRHR